MEWMEIKKKYPDQFVLMGNLIEIKLSESKSQIVGGKVLQVSRDAKEIRNAYQKFKHQGENVLYSLPSTPMEFIVEDIPLNIHAKNTIKNLAIT